VFNSLATRVDPAAHALLQDDPQRARTLLVVISADRGLCGSFNTNVIKSTAQYITEHPATPGHEVALALVGRKSRDFFNRRGFDVKYEEVGLFQNVKWAHAQAIANTCIKEFLGPDVSSVYLVYNEFRSVISQRVVIERLLPIPKLELDKVEGADYLFEPSPSELLDTLLPFHVAVQVNRALLESSAAEHAARMTAMDAATRNAKEMVDRLTLYMNKVRQAAITREIIEIVAGAQAI
jgi:F-type H+-transporting ATPase subunit gamma